MGALLTRSPIVAFVCRHGAAKSVLAAALFRRHAADLGVVDEIESVSYGLTPEVRVAPAVGAFLRAYGAPVPVPQRIETIDIEQAWRVVAFDLDPAALPVRPTDFIAWNDVPAVSADLEAARSAIDAHVEELARDCRRQLSERPVPQGDAAADPG